MRPTWRIANRYEIESPEEYILGEGHAGTVYQGIDTQTRRAVAIKVLHPAFVSENTAHLAGLRKENHPLRKLDHPNIPRLLSAGQEENYHYLIMAYAPGRPLRELLAEKGALPQNQALGITLEIARALEYTHRLGLFHNALHPGNILIEPTGAIQLTDFGIAPAGTEPVHSPKDVSPKMLPYLSPERCLGGTPAGTADLWSLGAVLYEMLTGAPLFAADSFTGLLKNILYGFPPFLQASNPEAPERLADLLSRMLEKKPQSRIPSAQQVSRQVMALIAGVPVPLERPQGMPRLNGTFVGRADDLTRLTALLTRQAHPLVTLTGPAGIGKTRLAIEAADQLASRYFDGVHFIPLGHLPNTSTLISTFAEVLYLSFYQTGHDPRIQLLNFLREKNALLVIDQCEHLRDNAAGLPLESLLADILSFAPGIQLLTTSEVPLEVPGETTYTVHPLSVPTAETAEAFDAADAVQLFIQRARLQKPDFNLRERDYPAFMAICRLTGGLPFALELLAAQTRRMSLTRLLDALDPLRTPTQTPARAAPIYQTALQTVLEQSFSALSPAEKTYLSALAIFRGGFTQPAAQKAAGVSQEVLASLTARGLLWREIQTGRYDLHPSVRALALPHLTPDQETALAAAHSRYYTAFLDRLARDLKSPRQLSAIIEAEYEVENVRMAWRHAVEHHSLAQLDAGLEGLSLFYMWSSSRHQEGAQACQQAVTALAEHITEDTLDLQRQVLRTLGWQARLSLWGSTPEAANALLEQAAAFLGALTVTDLDIRSEQAFILAQEARVQFFTAPARAQESLTRSLAISRDLGSPWEVAMRLWDLSDLALLAGQYRHAQALLEESLEILLVLGTPLHLATTMENLGVIANLQGRFQDARGLHEDALKIFQQANSLGDPAFMLELLGIILILAGKFGESHAALLESIQDLSDIGYLGDAEHVKILQCFPQLHLGAYQDVRVQAEKSRPILQTFDRYSRFRNTGRLSFVEGCAALAEANYRQAARSLQESVAVYQEINRQDELARSLAGLVVALRGLKQHSLAQKSLQEALTLAAETGSFEARLTALASAALLLIDRKLPERAVELYGLVFQHPFAANSRWFQDVYGKELETAGDTLPPSTVEKAWDRGRTLNLHSTLLNLLRAFRS